MKVFKFRGKKYKWTMQLWQYIAMIFIAVASLYGLMLLMFYIESVMAR